MANPKMVRGALGMISSPSEPKSLGSLGKLPSLAGKEAPMEESKPSIHDDPEAMEALRTLKEKGFEPEEIEEAMHSDDNMKAGVPEESMGKGFKAMLGR